MARPTFSAFDRKWQGTAPAHFSGLTVSNVNQIENWQDRKRAVVWGVNSQNPAQPLEAVVFGVTPDGWYQYHAPTPLMEGIAYVVELHNVTNGRRGRVLFGFRNNSVIIAPRTIREGKFAQQLSES